MNKQQVFALALMSLAMGACDKANTESAAATDASGTASGAVAAVATEATDEASSSMAMNQGFQCPAMTGAAPAGQLQAARIPAATSDQPGLYEGPVWVGDALYFSQFSFAEGFPSQVLKLKDGTLSVAIADSGSNGLAVDADGHLLAGTHKYKAVSRYNLADGNREPVVTEYDGNVFNSPNDLTVSREGVLYFTDPDFQRSAAPGGQDETRVYRVEQGEVSVVDASIANPNGVSLSPDQQTLYVAGGGEQGFVRAYDLVDGKPGNPRELLAPVTVPDGMGVDCQGNLYVTEHTEKRVRVITPAGKEIAEILVDANVTNVAFGGSDHKTLFITGAGAVWSISLEVAGFPY